ncbi:MAG: immune inhibitor A, partial [Chloroflexi bacterium]|nr:immune inhibitor A [Chloroflexota bacterium]
VGAPTGATAAHGGANVLGAGLAGPIGDLVNEAAVTPSIDLSQAVDPVLVAWIFYDTERLWDGGNVAVTTAANPAPAILDPVAGYTGLVDALAEDGFTGGSQVWIEHRFDLKPYAGQQINLVFKFASDDSVPSNAFYVDDIKVGEASVVGSAAPAGTVIYSEDFEGTPTTTAATGSQWEVGTPSIVGPAAASQGQKCAGTVIAAMYANFISQDYLKTATLDFNGATGGTLTFKHWYQTESIFDGGRILVTADDVNYEAITPLSGYPGNVFALGQQPGFNGDSTRWTTVTVDLTPLLSNPAVGRTFKVVFEFATDDSITAPGWYIDEIKVYRQ